MFEAFSNIVLQFVFWIQGTPLPDGQAFEVETKIQKVEFKEEQNESALEEKFTDPDFSRIGLKTNTNITSIPLSEVLGGGPHKDGIPAITNPQNWDSVEQAASWLKADHLGVLYEYEGEKRFYPYDILYWHEIVNDQIGDHAYSVTFCPLCGSVLIFDRYLDGNLYTFGVSGKLWESNLLMYDQTTETLWSQIRGEAMVGDLTGKKLNLLSSQVLSFTQLQSHHPKAIVMTPETGHRRAYGSSPYGDYETNSEIMFGVKNEDKTFHPKELFYIVNYQSYSVGFHLKDLKQKKLASLEVDGKTLTAEFTRDKKIIIRSPERHVIPGYFAMWFSWKTHQDLNKSYWSDTN